MPDCAGRRRGDRRSARFRAPRRVRCRIGRSRRAPRNALLRRGFTKNSLPPGTVIIVEGHHAKDGGPRMNGTDLTFPDGKKLFFGSSGTGAPYDKRPEAQ